MTANARRLAVLHDQCLEDLEYFVERAPKLASKTLKLMRETLRDPATGLESRNRSGACRVSGHGE